MIFDFTHKYSFQYVGKFLSEIYDIVGPIPSILLGNKCDTDHDVADFDIKQIEEKYNTKFFEVSARDGSNIDTAFDYLIREAVRDTLDEVKRLESLITFERKCNIY